MLPKSIPGSQKVGRKKRTNVPSSSSRSWAPGTSCRCGKNFTINCHTLPPASSSYPPPWHHTTLSPQLNTTPLPPFFLLCLLFPYPLHRAEQRHASLSSPHADPAPPCATPPPLHPGHRHPLPLRPWHPLLLPSGAAALSQSLSAPPYPTTQLCLCPAPPLLQSAAGRCLLLHFGTAALLFLPCLLRAPICATIPRQPLLRPTLSGCAFLLSDPHSPPHRAHISCFTFFLKQTTDSYPRACNPPFDICVEPDAEDEEFLDE